MLNTYGNIRCLQETCNYNPGNDNLKLNDKESEQGCKENLKKLKRQLSSELRIHRIVRLYSKMSAP